MLTQYSADLISISSETDLSQEVNPGTRISFASEVSPAAAARKTVLWNVIADDGTQLTDTYFTDNVLRIGTEALSKTLIVTAQSEDGACVSNELHVKISDVVQDELNIPAAEDVFVSGWSSDKDKNYSSSDYLHTTVTRNTDKKYTLIKFHIPQLGDEVGGTLSTELVLTYKEQTEPEGVKYYAYEYDGEWEEDNITWNSMNGDSYDKGEAIAESTYINASKQMVFELPEDYIKENAGKTVTFLIDSPEVSGVRTYWYSRESGGDTYAPVINFSYIVDTSKFQTVSYGPYWADDVKKHQGSNGDTAYQDFGNFKNVDETIKLFFPNAADGDAIGSYDRINAIDNGTNSSWRGYVTITINAEGDGDHTVYMLGNTNASDRSIEITNETTGESAVSEVSSELTEYSTLNYMRVFSVELRLERGENVLRIQAPEGEAAPNFIALYATGEILGVGDEQPTATATAAPETTPITTPTATPTATPTSPPTATPAATPEATSTPPTSTPTAAPPTDTPEPYEIVSYTAVNNEGNVVIESACVRAEDEESVRLYTAVYDSDMLVALKLNDITESGESTVEIGLKTDPDNTVKMFLWRNMEPLTAAKHVSIDASKYLVQ